MKNTILFLTLVLILTACSKEEQTIEITVSNTIEGAKGELIAEKEFEGLTYKEYRVEVKDRTIYYTDYKLERTKLYGYNHKIEIIKSQKVIDVVDVLIKSEEMIDDISFLSPNRNLTGEVDLITSGEIIDFMLFKNGKLMSSTKGSVFNFGQVVPRGVLPCGFSTASVLDGIYDEIGGGIVPTSSDFISVTTHHFIDWYTNGVYQNTQYVGSTTVYYEVPECPSFGSSGVGGDEIHLSHLLLEDDVVNPVAMGEGIVLFNPCDLTIPTDDVLDEFVQGEDNHDSHLASLDNLQSTIDELQNTEFGILHPNGTVEVFDCDMVDCYNENLAEGEMPAVCLDDFASSLDSLSLLDPCNTNLTSSEVTTNILNSVTEYSVAGLNSAFENFLLAASDCVDQNAWQSLSSGSVVPCDTNLFKFEYIDFPATDVESLLSNYVVQLDFEGLTRNIIYNKMVFHIDESSADWIPGHTNESVATDALVDAIGTTQLILNSGVYQNIPIILTKIREIYFFEVNRLLTLYSNAACACSPGIGANAYLTSIFNSSAINFQDISLLPCE